MIVLIYSYIEKILHKQKRNKEKKRNKKMVMQQNTKNRDNCNFCYKKVEK